MDEDTDNKVRAPNDQPWPAFFSLARRDLVLTARLSLFLSLRGPQITLKSSDDDTFEVSLDVANMSETIKNMIEGKSCPRALFFFPSETS